MLLTSTSSTPSALLPPTFLLLLILSLSALSAVQRLMRIGIAVYAIDERHAVRSPSEYCRREI